MKWILTAFLFFICSTLVLGQTVLKGVVQNAATKTPVPAASVFFNNTSIGTTAGTNGQFTIQVPNGKYELIVSSVGYETYTQVIIAPLTTEFITIHLQPKAEELANITIEPFEKNGWEKWGQFFTENFIGFSDHAKACTIKNKEAIKFRHSKKDNELSVVALEPLIIENKSLGYTITYQLESFSYNFKSHYLLYQGYPFLQPMKGGAAKQRQWEVRRKDVYEGSVMHFMRSLYRNQLEKEGFSVRRLQKVTNTEKARVKEAKAQYLQRVTGANGSIVVTDVTPADSSAYFDRILAQPDVFDVIGKTILPGDSIAFAINPTTAGLYFDDYLLIIYKNREAPEAFVKMFPKGGTAMASQLTMMNKRDVEVQANGSYYNPLDLLSLGYWAWSEKMATLLPLDYSLPQKEE